MRRTWIMEPKKKQKQQQQQQQQQQPPSKNLVPRVALWTIFFLLELLCVRFYIHSLSDIILPSYHDEDHPLSSSSSSTNTNTNTNALHALYAHTPMKQADFLKRSTNTIPQQEGEGEQGEQEPKEEKEEVGNNWEEVPERTYPKSNHIMEYTTSATELEIEKHDRLIVQGMVFMKQQMSMSMTSMSMTSMTPTPPQAQATRTTTDTNMIAQYTPSPQQKKKQFICVNIYLCNRTIPYINALLMSLMSHSTQTHRDVFLETVQVRLLNTEKRIERMDFPYIDNTLSKLPFVHQVHPVNYSDEIYQTTSKNSWTKTTKQLDFREQFISDQISGLNICIESNLPYCIMMEEDAVVPVDFTSLLLKHIIQPLENEGTLNRSSSVGEGGGGGGSGGEQNSHSQVSLISLYSYYNLVHFGEERLHYSSYAKRQYRQERAKSNAERYSQGLPPYSPDYTVKEKDYKYGTVAILYTRESAIQLVEYLRSVGVEPIHNADEFINAQEYFPDVMQIPRRHVEPSLVNHIGYYSERMGSGDKMFSQLNTDVRFMYDAGRME